MQGLIEVLEDSVKRKGVKKINGAENGCTNAWLLRMVKLTEEQKKAKLFIIKSK